MDSRRNSLSKMSTPLRENNRRFSHSPLLSPASSRLIKNQYCVSDTSSPNSKMLNNYSPGPLLAPTNYNTNLSTYIDCKSPGLSGRIVQYNDDAAGKTEPFVSHQAKYGSPGIYPIVHLQKKSLPFRRLPRDSVTMRLVPTHDSPLHYMHTNGFHSHTETSSTSTSSVLNALKEISKKRLLSEDLTQPQNNHKRQRNDCHIEVSEINAALNNLTNVAVKDTSKKSLDEIPCVVDALAASLTSSNTSLMNSRNRLKRKIDKTPPKESPKHILIEVETQTDNIKVNSDTQTVDDEPKQKELLVKDIDVVKTKTDIHTKVYEGILKDKLASRLATLTGEKQLVVPGSILSPPDKQKHGKHVSFDVPASSTEKTTLEVSSAVTPISISVTGDKAGLTTPTPLNSPVLPEEVPVTSKIEPVVVQPSIQTSVSTIMFSAPNTVSISTSVMSKSTSSLFTSPTSVTFTASSTFSKSSSPSLVLPSTSASALQSTTTSSHSLTSTSLAFSSMPSAKSKLDSGSKPAVTSTSITFGPMPVTSQKPFGIDMTVTNAVPITYASAPFSEPKLFNQFEAPSGVSTSIEQKASIAKPAAQLAFTSSTNKPGGFKFNLGGSSSVANTTVAVTTAEPSFNFGSSNPSSSPTINFGSNTKVTSAFNASSIFSTGFETKMSNVIPSVSATPSITSFTSAPVNAVTTETKSFNFGAAVPTTAPVFGTVTQTTTESNIFKFAPAVTTASSAFTTLASSNTTPVSTNTNTFKFGAAFTTPSIFSAPSVPSTSGDSHMFKFGSTTSFIASSTFKDPKPASESTLFSFNTPTTSVSPAFGTPAFSSPQPSNESIPFKFGASTAATTTSSLFNKPTFNASTQNKNEQGLFKFGSATTTTAAGPLFNAPAFNFTASAPTSSSKAPLPPPSFGTTNTNFDGFGSFESKPANPFNSSGFGETKSATPFGSLNQTFGAENKPTSVFGTATQNQNNFGSFNNPTPFGSAAPVQTAPAQPFQFGASNNTQTNVFSFGAGNEAAKQGTSNLPSGVFSFGANTTSNAFGSTPTPAFGTPAATGSNFNMQMPAVPNFGSPIQGTPMFSIGTGSSTPKPRTQLKARRRT